jgi:hypothetical protein
MQAVVPSDGGERVLLAAAMDDAVPAPVAMMSLPMMRSACPVRALLAGDVRVGRTGTAGRRRDLPPARITRKKGPAPSRGRAKSTGRLHVWETRDPEDPRRLIIG